MTIRKIEDTLREADLPFGWVIEFAVEYFRVAAPWNFTGTHPEWGEAVAKALPNGHVVRTGIDGRGHECTAEVEFLA